jgi:hypothetical protein
MEDPLLELPEELGSKCLLDCSVVAPLRRLCTSCNANISIHEQCADLLFSKQGYVDCKYPCTARYSLEFSRLGDFSQRPRGVLRCCRPGYDAGILRYALSTMNGLSLLCALLASLLLLLFTAYYGTMHNFVMPVHTVFQVALLVLMNGSSTHLFHYVTVFRSISIAKQYVLLEMVVLSATYTISAMSHLQCGEFS